VLKANKEKAAAEKREKERLRAQQAADGEGLHSRSGSDGEGMSLIGLGRGPMDLPKDRNQLANMRVIRRNLVYAVGLPPSIANEETLRKPEYFGQYGKISKIVLNRSNTTGGDPRRASASAYVTFAHKEDTLSSILALDGFYVDGRNVRASYGTSKYCSAFIKNVRCNNPECTYLHCMGDAEDTFTKQEIQAGYVTSGRDVLARQQQIVAQALSAASGNAANGGGARRKTGGGGPSGTGKPASNPQFPPPTFDEPLKSSSTSLVPPPPSAAPIARSSSGPGFSSVAAAGTTSAAKLTRSNSGTGQPGTPVLGAVPAAAPKGTIGTIVGAPNSAFPTPAASSRKIMGTATASASTHASAGAPGATAASVVAGVHSSSAAAEPPASHQTLTPLTPLKRASSSAKSSGAPGLPGIKSSGTTGEAGVQLPPNMPVPKGLNPEQRAAFLEQRREAMAAMARQQTEMAMKLTSLRQGGQKSNGPSALNGQYGTAPTSPSSSISSAGDRGTSTNPLSQTNSASNDFAGVGSIGGTVIGGAPIGGVGVINSGALGGPPIGGSSGTKGLTSSLGGEIYTGPPAPSTSGSIIGSGNDKWNSELNRDGLFSGSGNNDGFALNSGGIWDGSEGQNRSPGVIGGGSSKAVGTIGGGSGGVIGGTPFGSSPGGYNAGSSALASMLGISLPTGSGSLRESSSLWDSSSPAPAPIAAGVIGAGAGPKANSAQIGGFSIGGGGASSSGGSFQSNSISPNPVGSNSNNRDIALLQTLLPGVHITSSNNQQPPAQPSSNGGFGAVGGGWNASGPPVSQSGMGGLNGNPQNQSGGTWGGSGVQPAPVGARGGILGQNNSQQNQKQGQSSIW